MCQRHVERKYDDSLCMIVCHSHPSHKEGGVLLDITHKHRWSTFIQRFASTGQRHMRLSLLFVTGIMHITNSNSELLCCFVYPLIIKLRVEHQNKDEMAQEEF